MGAGCAALRTEETVELELAAEPASARPLFASLRVAVEANGRGVFASLHTDRTTARRREHDAWIHLAAVDPILPWAAGARISVRSDQSVCIPSYCPPLFS